MKMHALSKLLMPAAVFGIALASCTKEPLQEHGGQTEIRLGSGIELQSKASFTQADTQIPAGEQVYVWIDRNVTDLPALYGQTMTADGSGNLSGGTKMFFPMNGDHINIYSLHTNAAISADTYPAETFTHEVKATFPETNTQLVEGTEVRVWVDEAAETAVPLYENNVFTANGEGGLYGGETMYYPASENPVNIYALKTNATITGNTYPASALQHSVSTDQTALEDFVNSDLLYADATGITNDVEVVPLTFYHLLTKVQVAVTPAEGLVKEDIAGLELNGVQILAEYTLSKSVSSDAVEITPEGEIRTIVIGHDISDDFETPAYNDAVIVPQTLDAGTSFIVVTLLDGTRLAYQLPGSTTFTAQTAYQYHITVKRDGMVVTTSVTDWLPGGIIEGEADIVL